MTIIIFTKLTTIEQENFINNIDKFNNVTTFICSCC